MLAPHSVYGYVSEKDIEEAIEKRLRTTGADKKDVLASLLGEAINTLLKINSAIPISSRHRHLISGPMEEFANGSGKETYPTS
jgi:hypothetical protein